MYTGTMINDLLEMVARAEGHAQQMRTAAEREDQLLASYFAYQPADSQPTMFEVA